MQTISRESMADMMKAVGSATELLAEKGVDAIYLGGVPPIVMQHPGYDLEVVAEMEKRGGVPASTDVTGVMDAFRELGITRLVMAAPFEDWVIDLIKKYYGAAGFDIAHMKGMPLKTSTQRRALRGRGRDIRSHGRCFAECKEPVDNVYIPYGGWGTSAPSRAAGTGFGQAGRHLVHRDDLVRFPEQAWGAGADPRLRIAAGAPRDKLNCASDRRQRSVDNKSEALPT